MRINPFEYKQNEYDLKEILEKGWWGYVPKKEYQKEFGIGLDYDILVKSIDTSINWHILTTGSYQGDYWYIGQKDNKIYFIDIGYGSCSGCDNLLAVEDDIDDLITLQRSIKNSIREFDNMEELLNWIVNCNEWWLSEKDEILDYIKKEFNIDFVIIKSVKLKTPLNGE